VADTAEIGVFGGSGFYSLLDDVREVKVDTPFGPPSDAIFLAEVAGRRVAFLPRHGRRHTIPPHRINYRANVWAMRSLGVKAAISPCAAGSLTLHGPSTAHKGAILSFTLDGAAAQDVAQLLDLKGVCVRHGHHCTMPLHHWLCVPATVRASLAMYNTTDDVDTLVDALQFVREKTGRD
jgi:hypothetical protein